MASELDSVTAWAAPAGDLLEVGQRGLDVVLVLGRVEAEPGAEGGQALGDGPTPRPAPEQRRHHADEHADATAIAMKRISWVWLRLTSPGPLSGTPPI